MSMGTEIELKGIAPVRKKKFSYNNVAEQGLKVKRYKPSQLKNWVAIIHSDQRNEKKRKKRDWTATTSTKLFFPLSGCCLFHFITRQ